MTWPPRWRIGWADQPGGAVVRRRPADRRTVASVPPRPRPRLQSPGSRPHSARRIPERRHGRPAAPKSEFGSTHTASSASSLPPVPGARHRTTPDGTRPRFPRYGRLHGRTAPRLLPFAHSANSLAVQGTWETTGSPIRASRSGDIRRQTHRAVPPFHVKQHRTQTGMWGRVSRETRPHIDNSPAIRAPTSLSWRPPCPTPRPPPGPPPRHPPARPARVAHLPAPSARP